MTKNPVLVAVREAIAAGLTQDQVVAVLNLIDLKIQTPVEDILPERSGARRSVPINLHLTDAEYFRLREMIGPLGFRTVSGCVSKLTSDFLAQPGTQTADKLDRPQLCQFQTPAGVKCARKYGHGGAHSDTRSTLLDGSKGRYLTDEVRLDAVAEENIQAGARVVIHVTPKGHGRVRAWRSEQDGLGPDTAAQEEPQDKSDSAISVPSEPESFCTAGLERAPYFYRCVRALKHDGMHFAPADAQDGNSWHGVVSWSDRV